jgi:hypothetical protein
MSTTLAHRPICFIANDISKDWGKKVNFAARPYLDAMLSVSSPQDSYGMDSAESVVLYFLANASSYRGDKAREYKAELRAILGKK